jgi:carbonic anhydrase
MYIHRFLVHNYNGGEYFSHNAQYYTTVNGHIHKYSSPSIFDYIFHIKPHFFQKNISKLSLGRLLTNNTIYDNYINDYIT